MRKVQKVAGKDANIEIDLDADFDPDDYDAKMAQTFNESYYSTKSKRPRVKIDDDEPVTGFRYRSVARESFGLDVLDILQADDGDLNQFLSLKKLNPYKQQDSKKYTKRAKKFKDSLWRGK